MKALNRKQQVGRSPFSERRGRSGPQGGSARWTNARPSSELSERIQDIDIIAEMENVRAPKAEIEFDHSGLHPSYIRYFERLHRQNNKKMEDHHRHLGTVRTRAVVANDGKRWAQSAQSYSTIMTTSTKVFAHRSAMCVHPLSVVPEPARPGIVAARGLNLLWNTEALRAQLEALDPDSEKRRWNLKQLAEYLPGPRPVRVRSRSGSPVRSGPPMNSPRRSTWGLPGSPFGSLSPVGSPVSSPMRQTTGSFFNRSSVSTSPNPASAKKKAKARAKLGDINSEALVGDGSTVRSTKVKFTKPKVSTAGKKPPSTSPSRSPSPPRSPPRSEPSPRKK